MQPCFTQHAQWSGNIPRGSFSGIQPANTRYNYASFSTYNHWCETCDRGFPNMSMLEKHRQQHQKCNVDGCQFVAHPKMITKHIQMQHSTGLYKKLAKLQDPLEIKKWLEERKKRYPSKVNVEKKAAELKEKIERGEKMGLKCNKGVKNYKQGENLKRNRSVQFKNKHNRKANRQSFNGSTNTPQKNDNHKSLHTKYYNEVLYSKKCQEVLPIVTDSRKLKPFVGIRNIIINSPDVDDTKEKHGSPSYFIDYDEDDVEIQKSCPDKPAICNALSSLISNYGSDEEVDPTLPTNAKEPRLQNIQIEQLPEKTSQLALSVENKICYDKNKDSSNDGDGPEEAVIIKNIDLNSNSEILSPNKNSKECPKQKFIKKYINPKRTRSKLPSTLLQKLLHNEIRHERNTVLQCIRYIVQNKFFDKK